ncbi:MAG: glucokinase [Burkholderiaceae bacterium]
MSNLDPSRTDLRLLADVGGTNACFALQAGATGPITRVQALPCANHASLREAIEHYLSLESPQTRPVRAAIAIANPIQGDQVQMTNHHWSFSIASLRETLGLAQLELLNDFTALALALPYLLPADLRQSGAAQCFGAPQPHGAGPCRSGNRAGRLRPGPRWAGRLEPLQGEGGHVTLSAANDAEQVVPALLRLRFGHVSAERAVSGQGLSNLYGALTQRDTGNWPQPLPTAAAISQRALEEATPAPAKRWTCFLLSWALWRATSH